MSARTWRAARSMAEETHRAMKMQTRPGLNTSLGRFRALASSRFLRSNLPVRDPAEIKISNHTIRPRCSISSLSQSRSSTTITWLAKRSSSRPIQSRNATSSRQATQATTLDTRPPSPTDSTSLRSNLRPCLKKEASKATMKTLKSLLSRELS